MFLNKSLRYINSAISNEKMEEHFASYKLLNSAAKNLENFLNDEEHSSILESGTMLQLSKIIEMLCMYSEKIEKSNCLDLDNETSLEIKKPNEESCTLAKTPDGNIANDWILSEFNLSSNDFKSELSLIAGSLFDLNFTYQLCKVLNSNCLLMRHRTDESLDPQKYVLKVLKSLKIFLHC